MRFPFSKIWHNRFYLTQNKVVDFHSASFICSVKMLFLNQIKYDMEQRDTKIRGWIKILGNKYLIASVLFIAWFFFFDENSFMAHQENKKRLEELTRQKKYYIERIASDKRKLEELKAGKEQLEKFSREQYFMSKSDEDVFIIVEEE